MTLSINTDLAFPETYEDVLRNLVLTQGVMLDFMEGIVQQMHGDDDDLMMLWQAAKAMNASTEVYVNG